MEKARDTGQIEFAQLLDRMTPEQFDAMVKLIELVGRPLPPTAGEVELARLRRIEAAARDILRVVRSLKGPLRMSRDTFDSLARALGLGQN